MARAPIALPRTTTCRTRSAQTRAAKVAAPRVAVAAEVGFGYREFAVTAAADAVVGGGVRVAVGAISPESETILTQLPASLSHTYRYQLAPLSGQEHSQRCEQNCSLVQDLLPLGAAAGAQSRRQQGAGRVRG